MPLACKDRKEGAHMSQEITTRAAVEPVELAPPISNPARGLTRHNGHPMDDFGSGRPVRPVEMQEASFFDFLDIINPLQHIPIVSSLYRAVTGDELKPFARVLGGALFGGPMGLARGVAEAVLEQDSGKDLGQHVAALFGADAAAGTPVATLHLAETPKPVADDANVPAVVALGLEPLADGPSEWGLAQHRRAAAASPVPPSEPGIAGGIADSRLLGGSEPLPNPPSVTTSTVDDATSARLKAFLATEPGAPIDKATLKWLVEATPVVSAAASAFGRPDPANPVSPPAGGPNLVAVAPPALDGTDAVPRPDPAPARAVTAPSVTAPSTEPVAPVPVPPSLDLQTEEQQSRVAPEPHRAAFAAAFREEFYEATFRAGPRQWQSPIMIAEPQAIPSGTARRSAADPDLPAIPAVPAAPSVAAADPDLPAIPAVPAAASASARTPVGAAPGPAAPGRQLAAAGLSDLPAVAKPLHPRIPAVVTHSGEPVLDRPSVRPIGTTIAIDRAVVAPPPPPQPPRPAVAVSKEAPVVVASVRAATPPPKPDLPAPVADSPRADHDEAEIAAASAAWLRAMPAASPTPAGLAQLEAPALRQTMTATPAPPAEPKPDPAAVDPGPTAMLSNELLAQVMMSNLDKYGDLARRRHAGPAVKAGAR